ncbi:hypothetical protein HDU88_005506 [Geranomyces variabilis]|nr:hypothetical protein HDU88_005506 [Geranomyces variabilis]
MSWKELSDDYFEKTPADDVHIVAWAAMVLPSLPLAEVVSVDATAWYSRFNNRRPAGLRTFRGVFEVGQLDDGAPSPGFEDASSVSFSQAEESRLMLKNLSPMRPRFIKLLLPPASPPAPTLLENLQEYEALQLLFQAYELAAVAKRETATAFADGLAENANAVSEVLSKRKLDEEEALPDPSPKKSRVQPADDGIIKVLEPGVVLSPDFGDFGDVVTRIKELQASSDADRGHKLLYWGALDFRSLEHKHPLRENETGLEFLSNETINKVKNHLSGLVTAAANAVSDSCASLLMVMRSVIENHTGNEPELTIAEIKSLGMRGGIPLLVEGLKKHIASFEAMVEPQNDDASADTMHSIALLRDALLKVDADDKETQWLLLVIQQMGYYPVKPIDPTERTTCIYQIVPFAINNSVGVRYGDGASKADATDKRRRSSTAGGGKKVDYLHLIEQLELGSGENSRKGFQDSDLVAGTKCGIAQIREIKGGLGNDLTERHPGVLADLLLKIAAPCYQAHDQKMSFRLTFNIGAELYALYQWACVNLPDDLESTLDMAENFLISEHIMLHTNAAVKHARTKLAFLEQRHVLSARTAGVRLNLFKKSKWRIPSESPMPGATPKKETALARKQKEFGSRFSVKDGDAGGGLAAKGADRKGDDVAKAAERNDIDGFSGPK